MYSGSVHVIVIMVYVFFSANASAGCGVIHTGHHLSDMTLRQCRPPMHEAATELESFFSDKLLHPTCTKKHYRFHLPFIYTGISPLRDKKGYFYSILPHKVTTKYVFYRVAWLRDQH
ncbi:hypothetical protein ATANTOWER_012916 [Ataeniobius toweri]|uniref:Secreted protein n=1 Tax=Ataeniobius toweri TaxID=208326 RepID=A0ABU7B6V0_9TELE|nr:hypothetical protein [Ataeniobius toweri]